MEFPKMTAICVCGGCGRTVEKNYVFCPWCGHSRVCDDDAKEAADSVQEMNVEERIERRAARLDEMEKKLDALEKELKILI
ncbi:MAG: hypothetical protein K2F89_06495 [Treponemataceae bacterium]|nr:hypothetical protein [Treponemataceae bacterium]